MKSYCHIYAQLDQTADRLGEEAAYLQDLGLAFDTTFSLAQGGPNRTILRKIADAGGLCALNLYPRDCDPSYRDPNWWKYSADQCAQMLLSAVERYAKLEIGPMRAVNTYTPGNAFITACRQQEIGYVLGFCAPIVIEDGEWEIAHYGSPLSPYFVSEEDFRKPAAPRKDGRDVLMASMELRNPSICLNHWSEGPWCPLNALAADRWLEPGPDPLPFLQIAEDWLRQAEMTGSTLFFSINLQYFFAGRCYEHNRRALAWIAAQRDAGRLTAGGLRQWEAQLRGSAEGFVRQTSYWRGEMMGFHVGHRAGCPPDVIVDENIHRQCYWTENEPLPRRLYDYGTPWDFPAFEPLGHAPVSATFENLEISIGLGKSSPLFREWTVEIRNSGTACRAPLLIWEAARGWSSPFAVEAVSPGWTARIVPHPAGEGGAIQLEGKIPTGHSTVSCTLRGGGLGTMRFSQQWAGLVTAQSFVHDGRIFTVLAAQTPDPFSVIATVTGRSAKTDRVLVEHLIGREYECANLDQGQALLRFDGTRLACWHRFWDVNADQIVLSGVEETRERLQAKTALLLSGLCPGLTADGPGYQSFGNLREKNRWDLKLAHAAGEKEIAVMNGWFHEQRGDPGQIVIEAHPGAFLPRGSITKVLGKEFNVIICQDGYGFREICADYPQSWDWGVAAWVQWRHLRLRIDGLDAAKGDFRLHLHAFDPEGRDFSQSVFFFNPEDTETAPLLNSPGVREKFDICAARDWALPHGLDGRWDSGALCSMAIPRHCLQWPAIGVWIVPLQRDLLHDWISEAGAPGMISHLWVTRRNP